MPEVLEDIPTMTATERFIETAKREDVSVWERTDDLREAVDEHLDDEGGAAARAGKTGVKTGLGEAIAEVWSAAYDAGLVELEREELGKDYRTAVAWPQGSRIEGATYAAHREVRALSNRRTKLAQWVRQSQTGRVGRDQARLLRQGLKPSPKPVSPPDRFDHAVRGALKRWATGGQLTEGERLTAVGLLQDLIGDIEGAGTDAANAVQAQA